MTELAESWGATGGARAVFRDEGPADGALGAGLVEGPGEGAR